MKRNQLKLRIWNVTNRNMLSEEALGKLERNLSEDELGAFVDLFSDTVVCSALVDDCKNQEEAAAVFADVSACKEMAARYYDMLCKTGIRQLREHVFCNDLEGMIAGLQADVEIWPDGQSDLFRQSALHLLNYMKVLRAKVDVPSLDISAEEGRLLEALENNFDADEAAVFFRLLLMYYDYVSDYRRVAGLLERHWKQIREVIVQEYEVLDMISNIGSLCLFWE